MFEYFYQKFAKPRDQSGLADGFNHKQRFKEWARSQRAGADSIKADLENASPDQLMNLAHILAGLCEFDDAQIYVELALDRAEASNEPTTTAFTLYVTELCNLRCQHCFIYDDIAEPFLKRSDEMTVNEIVRIVDGLRLNETNRHLFLTGGEVFARKDFEEIVEGISNLDVKFSFGTNGMFPERLEKILTTPKLLKPIAGIQFSLDGARTGHENVRGKGTFDPLMKSMKIVKQHGLPLNACTVIQDGNDGEVAEVQTLIRELGVDNHRFQLFSKADQLMTKDISRFENVIEEREFYQATVSPSVPGKGCLAGVQSAIIRSNGIVEACRLSAVGNVPHLIMGDLKEHNFKMDSLLGSDQCQEVLRKVGKCPGCALYCAR